MPAQLKSRCPHCQAVVRVNDSLIGKRVRCPACKTAFELISAHFASGTPSLDQSPQATETISPASSDTSRESEFKPPSTLLKPTAHGRLGRFELKDLLGQGAFGRVYKAYDPQLDRFVALKVPTFGPDDKHKVQRFIAEAKAAARLRHPNIVPTYESGQADGQYYIASQFVAGQPLSKRLKDNPPDFRQSADWVRQLADALAYAHSEGIVHRDIKPDNIMLDQKGIPQIMDFGLAKRLNDDAGMTTDGSLLGTPAYMSPEQARGKTAEIGPASDQYSLGVVLYELLTGKRPFEGPTHAVIAELLVKDPPSPRSVRADIPRDLEAICQVAINKDAVQRYETCSDLAGDLARWLGGYETLASPLTIGMRTIRWCRRNQLVTSLSLTTLLLLLLGTVFSTFFAIRSARNATEASFHAELALNNERAATAAKREVELTLADMQTSFGLFTPHKAEAALWFASSASKSETDHARRDANLVRFQTWTSRQPRPYRMWANPGSDIVEMSFHPSDRYLLAKSNSTFKLRDLGQDREIPWRDPSRKITAASWSPDGKTLVVGDDTGQVDLFSFPEGLRFAELTHAGSIASIAFSGDGSLLAIGSKTVRIWNMTSRQYLEGEISHPDAVIGISFDPNGPRFVTSCLDDLARVFRIDGNKLRSSPDLAPIKHSVHPGVLYGSSFPASFLVDSGLVVNDYGLLKWMDIGKGKTIASITLPNASITTLKVNRARDAFIVCGDPNCQVWDVREKKAVGALLQHQTGCPGAGLLPDRRAVTACTDRIARIWSTEGHGVPEHLFHGGPVTQIDCSHSGRLIATAQKNGTITIWATPPASQHENAIQIDPSETEVRLSRDRKYLVTSGSAKSAGTDRKICRTTRVCEVETLRQVGEVLPGPFHGVDISPNNRVVATAAVGRSAVSLWNWPAGTLVCPPVSTPSEPVDVAFSISGREVIAACVNGEITMIDVETGNVRQKMQHGAPARVSWLCPKNRWICISPSGDRFATLGFGNMVRLWDTETGRLVGSITHKENLTDAAFSPTGKYFATASRDSTAIVINAADGIEMARLEHPDCVFDAYFSKDETRLWTASRDRNGRYWNWQASTLGRVPIEREGEVGGIEECECGVWTQTTYPARERSMCFADDWGRPLMPSIACQNSWVIPDLGIVIARNDNELRKFSFTSLGLVPESLFSGAAANLLAEIAAVQRIENGAAVPLTDSEVLARWAKARSQFPNLFDLDKVAPPIADGMIVLAK